MDGTFACPDCGQELHLQGLSPGLMTRCDWCSATVEVPFLPRAAPVRRWRHARGHGWRAALAWPPWAWCVAVVLTLAIVLAGLNRTVRSRWKAAESSALARLENESVAAEKGGRLGEALAAAEAALALARLQAPNAPDPDLAPIRERRDRLARAEAEAQLAALAAVLGPGGSDMPLAVGRALTLQARTRSDRALDGLQDGVQGQLDRLRTLSAEADAADAARALQTGALVRAVELSDRQYRTADDLPKPDRTRLQGQALGLVRQLVAERGVTLAVASTHWTMGSSDSYAKLLNPAADRALLALGYIPRLASPTFHALWEGAAPPYQLTIAVKERQADAYLQSPNRLSELEAQMAFRRSGQTLWSGGANARTVVPLPGLPAYQASRLAVSARRSAEYERLFYENARASLIDRILLNLKNVPRLGAS